MPSPLPERFFLGGNLSPVCTLGGPTALWGFSTRGLGPTEPRRQLRSNPSDENADPERDYLGGDLAVTAFADLSFDFPLKWCRAKGIHGHIFASAGNVDKLTENAYQNFSFRKFAESFRSSVGVGIVVPTNLFRMEVSNLFYSLYFETKAALTFWTWAVGLSKVILLQHLLGVPATFLLRFNFPLRICLVLTLAEVPRVSHAISWKNFLWENYKSTPCSSIY